jgi:hypothetical protein
MSQIFYFRPFLFELRHQLLHRVGLLAEGQHQPHLQGDRLARRAEPEDEAVEVSLNVV